MQWSIENKSNRSINRFIGQWISEASNWLITKQLINSWTNPPNSEISKWKLIMLQLLKILQDFLETQQPRIAPSSATIGMGRVDWLRRGEWFLKVPTRSVLKSQHLHGAEGCPRASTSPWALLLVDLENIGLGFFEVCRCTDDFTNRKAPKAPVNK